MKKTMVSLQAFLSFLPRTLSRAQIPPSPSPSLADSLLENQNVSVTFILPFLSIFFALSTICGVLDRLLLLDYITQVPMLIYCQVLY